MNATFLQQMAHPIHFCCNLKKLMYKMHILIQQFPHTYNPPQLVQQSTEQVGPSAGQTAPKGKKTTS